MTSHLLRSSLLAPLLMILVACSEQPLVLQPSGNAIQAPSQATFAEYIKQSQELILQSLEQALPNNPQGFMGGYTNQQARDMRAPFEWQPGCSGTGSGKGFLLLHGLTDSPFLMSDIASDLRQNYPCAVIRGLLLPGHGTIAGDSLEMTYQQWLDATRYSVDSLTNMDEINQVFLLGFSAGASLIIKHLGQYNHEKIKGVVLLSAALKANSSLIALTPYLRHVKDWSGEYQEVDAARYESFSLNAAAEFYLLTKGLMTDGYRMQHPMLMVISADDSTIDATTALDYFCQSPTENKTLMWYQTAQSANKISTLNVTPACLDKVIYDKKTEEPGATANWQREFNGKSYLFANHAHTAITIKPDNPHYGIDGKYRHCRGYQLDGEEYRRCVAHNDTNDGVIVFAESGTNVAPGQLLRRGTFNPNYKRMLMQIVFFIDDSGA
ncbi:alpha/beta hydrolase [Aliiglaciecola sp. CAU 1673]|uniref:alpha/beta hydrolase n=1 Tax=Aliiglaciecola sp. CAU 1673 TaxID=3032595 RepID=UPI0023DC7A36|nr:alpha/beta hydrolase [Aliiglaciecola sp. CAU 1673]MDF2177024.1 alpha/beta hydrolase [Aliiglaciecola sp. CAU 1673]